MANVNYFVYCHTNKINGKKYIGITSSKKAEYRWGENGKRYYHNKHFYSSIQKYGWNNFKHEIIKENITKEEAFKIEKELIKKYNTTDKKYGYNIGEGGEHGAEGSKRTPEQNKLKSELMKVRMKDEKTVQKIKNNRKGMVFSETHIKNLKKSHLNHSPSNKGVAMSEEQKNILREKKKDKMKPVFCIENNKIYESIKAASIELNVRAGNISRVCNKKIKTAGNYHFVFVKENNT